jgi:hypothetical protein
MNMAKQERHDDGKFRSENRDNAGVDGPVPPTIRGTQVKISGEPGSGDGPKALGDQNAYAPGSEYSSPHNYDVGQQDSDKSRSR